MFWCIPCLCIVGVGGQQSSQWGLSLSPGGEACVQKDGEDSCHGGRNTGFLVLFTFCLQVWIYGGSFYSGTYTIGGNAGLLDQVLALKCIKENIIMFGGDNQRITLFSGQVILCNYSIYFLAGRLDVDQNCYFYRICWIIKCRIPPVVSPLQGSFHPGHSSVSIGSKPLGIGH